MLAAAASTASTGSSIPGGFGERGIEGKIAAAGYAREHDIPCLGLCLGLQVMVVEFARSVVGLEGANSPRVRPDHAAPGDRPDGRAGGSGRHGRHDAPRRLRRPCCSRARRWPTIYGADDRLRAPPAPLRGQPALPPAPRGGRARAARAPRRTVGWSSSSSCPGTRSGSAPRPTRSSRAARTGRTRCSASSSGRRSSAPGRATRTCSSSTLDADPERDCQPPGDRARCRVRGAFRQIGERERLPGRTSPRRDRHVRRPGRVHLRARDRAAPRRGVRRAARERPRARPAASASTGAPLDRALLELPAGKLDVPGEAAELCARRELAEEVGARGERPHRARSLLQLARFTDELTICFLAEGLVPVARAADGIEEQHMTVERVAFERVLGPRRVEARSSTRRRSSASAWPSACWAPAERRASRPRAQRRTPPVGLRTGGRDDDDPAQPGRRGVPLVPRRREGPRPELDRAYRRDLAAYEQFLADRGVDAGRGERQRSSRTTWPSSARRGLAACSRARALVAVRGLHGFCVDERGAAVDPTEDVETPRMPQGVPKALSEAEVERAARGGHRRRPPCAPGPGDARAALRDGMRISELAGLSPRRPRPARCAGARLRQGLEGAPRPDRPPRGRGARGLARARRPPGDPRRAHAPARATPRRCSSRRGAGGCPARRPGRSCTRRRAVRGSPRPGDAARAAPQLRHAPARPRGRHPGRPGAARPRVDHDDAGLHEGLPGAPPALLSGRAPPRGAQGRRRGASGLARK